MADPHPHYVFVRDLVVGDQIVRNNLVLEVGEVAHGSSVMIGLWRPMEVTGDPVVREHLLGDDKVRLYRSGAEKR